MHIIPISDFMLNALVCIAVSKVYYSLATVGQKPQVEVYQINGLQLVCKASVQAQVLCLDQLMVAPKLIELFKFISGWQVE